MKMFVTAWFTDQEYLDIIDAAKEHSLRVEALLHDAVMQALYR